MCLSRCEDEIPRRFLLEHAPHTFAVLRRVSPVPFRVEVSKRNGFLQPELDTRRGERHLPCHESLAPSRRFVVEKDPVACIEIVRFPVVDHDPVAVQLCNAVRTSRVERCHLALRHLPRLAEQFACRSLIEARLDARFADRIQKTKRPHGINLRRILGDIE